MNSVHTINLKKSPKSITQHILHISIVTRISQSWIYKFLSWAGWVFSIREHRWICRSQGHWWWSLMAPADGSSPHAMAQIRAQMSELTSSSSCPSQQSSPFPSLLSPPLSLLSSTLHFLKQCPPSFWHALGLLRGLLPKSYFSCSKRLSSSQ